MRGRNFRLSPRLGAFVDRQVESGRHRSASEVVREALRRYEDDLEAEQATLDWLRGQIAPGLAQARQGLFVEGTVREIFRRIEEKLDAEDAGRP
jgi:antitoxin ParD1/3/4